MILAWQYYWPAILAAVIVGALTGARLFAPAATDPSDGLANETSARPGGRRRKRLLLGGGVLLTVALTALWHGPVGTAGRFAAQVHSIVRAELVYLEMTQVRAELTRTPLARQLRLSGPADDFQRSELARILGGLPGVASARWTDSRSRSFALPLLAEASLASVIGFLLGLLLAYLVELRRRANAEWRW